MIRREEAERTGLRCACAVGHRPFRYREHRGDTVGVPDVEQHDIAARTYSVAASSAGKATPAETAREAARRGAHLGRVPLAEGFDAIEAYPAGPRNAGVRGWDHEFESPLLQRGVCKLSVLSRPRSRN